VKARLGKNKQITEKRLFLLANSPANTSSVKSTLLIFIFFLPLCCSAQQEKGLWSKPQKIKGAYQKKGKKLLAYKSHLEKWGLDSNYNRGLAIGGQLNATGWTGLLNYQRRMSRTQNAFFQLAFSEIKHEKQIKQQRQNIAYPSLGNSSPFIYGKINNAYQIQLGYGREQLLLPGLLEGNMTISLKYQAGISVLMLKPYYLNLVYEALNPDSAFVREEKYTNENSELFLKPGNILGAAPWKKGLNEINFSPGAYIDVAICIEPLKNKTFIKTVNLGCNFSIHSKPIEIMALQKAYNWNAALYAGLSLGKRWK